MGLVVVAGMVSYLPTPSDAVVDWTKGATQLASVNSEGADASNAESRDPVLSHDGTKVVFTSESSDLDGETPDTNGTTDVYLRDLTTGATHLVSINSAGTGAGNDRSGVIYAGPTYPVKLSPDGNLVAFESRASDLDGTTPDTNTSTDVYVRDLANEVTMLVSVSRFGDYAAGGASDPEFSPDSSMVSYEQGEDVWVRDLVNGVTTLVSVNTVGTGGGNWPSFDPVFSPDGSMIAFRSEATDLDQSFPDENENTDVFIRHLETGVTELISVNAAETATGNNASAPVAFSPDSTKLVFVSGATDLDAVTPDTNNDTDIYLRDLTTKVTSLVSTNLTNTDAMEDGSIYPVFSPDGSAIAFVSRISGVFLRDLVAGETRVIEDWADNAEPAFAPDGTALAFSTHAHDLDPTVPDSYGQDVYLRDLASGSTTLLSVNSSGTGSGDGGTWGPVFSQDGTAVAFTSEASDLDGAVADTNEVTDVYVRSITPERFKIEAGTANVNHKWSTVELSQAFTDPVVIAGPASSNGSQPVTVRVRNVTPTGFEIKLDEYEYLDGWHMTEHVDYVVVERGHHTLPGGAQIVAGTIETSATRTPRWTTFGVELPSVPAVFTTVASHHGPDAVVTRVTWVNEHGFGVMLQEQEANPKWHLPERVDYVAWEKGTTGTGDPIGWEITTAQVSHKPTTISYMGDYPAGGCVVADMNTRNGHDTAGLRWHGKHLDGIQLHVDEEQSKDHEVWHLRETVVVLAIDCP